MRKRRVRVVAIGGGHGLAATLQAARRYADDITAVVSVADDGGSSGRLRAALGIPAPGDLRRCLTALAEHRLPWAEALEHRFGDGAGELGGHALGNLVIAGLTEAMGDFVAALDEVGRLVGAQGRVLPATCEPVVLKAEVDGADHVEGQVAVENTHRIVRVSLVPDDAGAPAAVVDAIGAAEQVVLGPGSLYTSVLAAAVVPDVRAALIASPAPTVYVCNLRPQIPETAGYTVADHVAALREHGIEPDVVLAHSEQRPLTTDGTAHDPELLAQALADLVL
ncbi:MAG: gluconeogenesis factor YvcK family protein [Actinomycetota bacterium]